MVVSYQENGKEATKNSMQFYCASYCEYSSVCTHAGTVKLASTVSALELMIIKDDFNFDYNSMPAKITQLSYIAKKTQAEIQNERYTS